MLTNLFKEEIETVISNLETQVKNNESIKKEDLDNLILNFNNLRKINNSYGNSKITVEDMKKMEDRISEIASTCDYELNLKAESSITDRSISMPVEEKESVFKRVKNKINKKVAAWAIIAGIAISGAAGLASCNKSNAQEVAVETQMTVSDEKSVEAIENEIAAMVNDMLAKGMVEEITEDQKEDLIEKAILYYYATRINNNTVTEKELAEIFGNTTYVSEDLKTAMHDINWINEQRATVGDKYVDYSLYYSNKNDVAFLNKANELLTKIKNAPGNEEYIVEFKEFIKDNIANSNNRMKYSAFALNEFRSVHFDAFLELANIDTNNVDKELESMMNTLTTCVIGEEKTESEVVSSGTQQSILETHLSKKFYTVIDGAKTLYRQFNDKLNQNKTFSKIKTGVLQLVDFSKQVVLPSYKEQLKERANLNAPAQISKDDSGIKVNGGNLSKSNMEKIVNQLISDGRLNPEDAKDPKKVQEAFDKPVPVGTINSSGNVDPKIAVQGSQDGYYDGNQGLAKNYRSLNAGYIESYNKGYAQGVEAREKDLGNLPGPTTTYEPVSGGPSTTTETETEEPYIGTQLNSQTPGSTFIRVDNGTKTVTESGETVYNYTKTEKNVSTESYSTQESIELLNAFKNMLNGETNSNAKTR